MKRNRANAGILSRLLVMFTAVILISVLLMLLVFAISSRQAQIDSRINALKVQAYDIAFLAGLPVVDTPLAELLNLGTSASRLMMERKLRAVYEDYAAYCLVVDRSGRVTGYFSQVIDQHQELASQWNPKDVVQTLARVLQGEEVVQQTQGETGPMFTVAVPWTQRDGVVGAVYIQTAAQTVQSSYAQVWQQAALAALVTFLVAATIAVLYTRRLVRPLRDMAASAGLMAKGLPAPPATETGFEELNELSRAFNHMSRQIQDTEETRKTFIANLSHELRSPMTSIQGFVQGILDDTVKPEDARQVLQIVLDETKRLNHLVSGLLSLSRAEAGEQHPDKQSFNVCELIRLVLITRMQALENKTLQVDTSFEQEEMNAFAVRHQIEQVLINLIDNAIRFTPQGGKLSLSVASLDKKTLAVTVSDNGVGIVPEDAERIFDRFYKANQAHTPGEGVGLGLSIVKAILERHGQTITLLPGTEGASFRFTLEKASDGNGRTHAPESTR